MDSGLQGSCFWPKLIILGDNYSMFVLVRRVEGGSKVSWISVAQIREVKFMYFLLPWSIVRRAALGSLLGG